MQNSNLIIISSTNTSTLRSIMHSGLKLRQLINNSNHSNLRPGAVSTIRHYALKEEKTNSTIRKIKNVQSK